jgi:hypothetical protein
MKIDFDRDADRVFVLLIGADLLFLTLHLMHHYTGWFNDTRYNVETDRGFGETYQYVKTFWIALLLGGSTVAWRRWIYAGWAALFAFLTIDDAFTVHEKAGAWLRKTFEVPARLGIRAQDWAEIVYALLVGAALTLPVAIGYLFGTATDRRNSRAIAGLLGILIAFGVGVDVLHETIQVRSVKDVVGTIEDGGEMLAMTAILWFVFRMRDRERAGPAAD